MLTSHTGGMSYRDAADHLCVYTIRSPGLTPVSCYTACTERNLSETWRGWRANPLLAEEAPHTPKNPTPSHPQALILGHITSHLKHCLPPVRFRQSAVMKVLRFHFQCWSEFTPSHTDKLRLVLTAHLLKGLTHHPLKVSNVQSLINPD